MSATLNPTLLAHIREIECIGCTKCIQACPVDALVGSAKQLHTVIQSECTGCGLCVAPCPVDCIEMIKHPDPFHSVAHAEKRTQSRQTRLARDKKEKIERTQKALAIAHKQTEIKAAIDRARAKKQQRDPYEYKKTL